MLDAEHRDFLRLCSKYQRIVIPILTSRTPHKRPKSIEISEDARKKGNELFQLKKHDDTTHALILEQYCKSIAFAPPGSEQILLALMNRSAFLSHIYKYEESLDDIEKAMKLCKNNELRRGKLLCRQLQCLKQLGYTTAYETVLEEVEFWSETIKVNQVKLDVKRLIAEVKSMPNRYEELNSRTKKEKALHQPGDKTKGTPKSVAIKFDIKNGRHLVATRNFKPGEIIFTEKSFVFMRNLEKKHTYCNYCFQICWSSVSCKHCTWASFCSETCKSHAWSEYHDVECSVLPDATEFYELCREHREKYHLWVRMLTIGIKQAGSIANFKAELTSRDKLRDISAEAFFRDGKIGNYSLADVVILNNEYNDPNFKTLESPSFLYILPFFIYFVKNSPFFKGMKNVNKLEEILKNNDATFVGSLLVKFAKMKPQMSYEFNNYDEFIFKQPQDSSDCRAMCGKQNVYYAPFLSLISHSCCPNVDSRCYTSDSILSQHMEGIVYALKPIQEGSKICITYVGLFYHMTKKQRQEQLTLYNIICDCPACNHGWPELLNPYIPKEIDVKYMSNLERDTAKAPFIGSMQFIEYVNRGRDGLGCDQNTINKISELITLGVTQLEQPSTLLCFLIEALRNAFTSIHGRKRRLMVKCRKQSK